MPPTPKAEAEAETKAESKGSVEPLVSTANPGMTSSISNFATKAADTQVPYDYYGCMFSTTPRVPSDGPHVTETRGDGSTIVTPLATDEEIAAWEEYQAEQLEAAAA